MSKYIPVPCSFFDQWTERGGFYDVQRAILDVVYLKSNNIILSPEDLMKRWEWDKPNVRQKKLINLAEAIWSEISELPIMDSNGITEASKLSLYLNDFNESAMKINKKNEN